MLFHNEHLVEEQPACGESVCSLTSFREYYQHLLELDLREECAAGTEENKDESNENNVSDEDDDSSQEDSDEDSSEESIEEDN